jgi:uncharacterized protein (TIGR03032 family)
MEKDKPDLNNLDLQSVFTSNLPYIFKKLNISLIASTYQAGKVILLRNQGNKINTHFRSFQRPMGIAVKPNRLTIGCKRSIEYYHNMPAMIAKLENQDACDACYIPRLSHNTGAIDIHEMSYGSNNLLWVVNTRFSTLCTIDFDNSFVPRWHPHFISALAPEDRCHLNGLAMINGKPGIVTALGQTDTANGWRSNKKNGGVLINVPQNKILATGLSMPHSPRWYNNRLYMLESGHGTLVSFDPRTLEKTVVARFPGFTRGLDFAGPLAFVGLSKVRETATFSDFPLLEELKERVCGVYVCNIQTGEIVGLVRFEGDVEEIFAVQVLQNQAFPEMLEPTDELIDSTYELPPSSMNQIAGTYSK